MEGKVKMEIKAYGKINLSLDVVSKKEDGYHLLKMIMQSIEVYDRIKLEVQDADIRIYCDKPYVPTDERNIAYKAAKLFFEKYKINKGVCINIDKHIPVSAGLAGGSTDGAAVIRGLSELFGIKDEKGILELCTKVGADVPFCLYGGTCLCEGIGEVITPLSSFKDVIILLVKPNFGVSTKEVFRALDLSLIYKHPDTESLMEAMKNYQLNDFDRFSKNVLENVTLRKYPIIRDIKLKIMRQGALYSMMSGSGPTVFGIFDDMQLALSSYEFFKKQYKETYLTRTI